MSETNELKKLQAAEEKASANLAKAREVWQNAKAVETAALELLKRSREAHMRVIEALIAHQQKAR